MNEYIEVLKKYAIFSGRAPRKEYWMYILINIFVSILVGIVGGLIHFGSLFWLYSVAILIPSLAVGVRRLHDSGHSGWWMLIFLIPFIGTIVLVIFFVLDSQPGENVYGPNPKGVGAPMGSKSA